MKIIGQRVRFGSHLGLERIQLICDALGNPVRNLSFIHIAGTSGKGSVSAFLAEVLMRSGLKVGAFTSPHLERYSERFRINGAAIDQESLNEVVSRAEAACRKVEAEHPDLGAVTEFELATAAGFIYFDKSQVDVVVLETGLGGRLDATNVVVPVLTVITTIGLDHEDRLGSTLEEIASEKGGIIKAGVPIISGVQSPAAEKILQRIALEKQSDWRSTKDVPWVAHGWSLAGGMLTFPEFGTLKIGLLGAHQLQNAATALLAVKELRRLGYQISLDAVRQGFEEASWPGRLEVVTRNPFMLFDGAHNREGIDALSQSLHQIQKELGGEKFTFLFGMLHNKSLSLLDPLLPLARRFVFSRADSGRLPATEPDVMVDYVERRGGSALSFEQLPEAMDEAMQTPPLCVCGSLYLVGSVKRVLRRNL